MKKILCLLVCFSLSSCFDFSGNSEPNIEDSRYKPVIIKRSDLKNSIVIKENVPMTESAKIYVVGDHIFINDKRKGFHIFDNTDPKNPIKKKFLEIPGATDIAIRNNVFYINQATDLVVLSFNLNNFTFKVNERLENVFPQLISPDGMRYKTEEGVIVDWIQK